MKQKPNFPTGFSAQNSTSKDISNCNLNELFVIKTAKKKKKKKKKKSLPLNFNHLKGASKKNLKNDQKVFDLKIWKKVSVYSWKKKMESKATSKHIVLFFILLKIDV